MWDLLLFHLSPQGTDAVAAPSSSSSSKKPKQVSASYVWSGLVRMDVITGPPSTFLAFHGPSTMRVFGVPLLNEGQEVDFDWDDADGAAAVDNDGDDEEQQQHGDRNGSSSRFLVGKESVAARGGLVPHTVRIPVPGIPTTSCLADVAVSGLPGWVGVYAPFAKQQLVLRVWVPRGVEVFLRPPLPCPSPRTASAADGDDEGGVVEADLADIGRALDIADGDQDWEQHR